MERIIGVPRAGRTPSQVIIGNGAASRLRELLSAARTIVITDPNVERHWHALTEGFERIVIGTGESSKTLATVEEVYRRLIALDADRTCCIVGVGGGIVTDVAGFVASTFMRGVRFGFVATTLLAQVDASVGGKNGVNVDGFKNMAGVFNQPDFVLCDSSMLATLPGRELRAGLSEAIKSGIIADAELFERIEAQRPEELFSDLGALAGIVASAVGVKSRIVEADEREAGERRLLNLGHTFAHAVEKCTGRFLHGEAVAIGMDIISRIAVATGDLSRGSCERIRSLLLRVGLPVESGVEMSRLLRAVRQDKKRSSESIYVTLPCEVGRCRIAKMPLTELERLALAVEPDSAER